MNALAHGEIILKDLFICKAMKTRLVGHLADVGYLAPAS
jgi:hypothetical protein